MLYAMENMNIVSLDAAFENGMGIAVSISKLPVFPAKLL